METDAELFKRERKELKTTQKQLGADLGCGEIHINRVEKGKVAASRILKKCLDYFVQLSELKKLLNNKK